MSYCRVCYRSPQPLLAPEKPEERTGLVDNVIFPTGCDQRLDLGMPNRLDIYYGMADSRIGVARLEIPDHLPEGSRSERDEACFEGSSRS